MGWDNEQSLDNRGPCFVYPIRDYLVGIPDTCSKLVCESGVEWGPVTSRVLQKAPSMVFLGHRSDYTPCSVDVSDGDETDIVVV